MTKKKYEVTHIQIQDYGDGRIDELVLGKYETWASSDKRAINNIKFRLSIKPQNMYCEWSYDGSRRDYFEAVPV